MSFTNKYSHLGKTALTRIPKHYVTHVQKLLEHYNRICVTHDAEFLDKVITSLESGLERIN